MPYRPEPDVSAVVLTERRGPSLRITINRPDRRNALNAEVLSQIARGLDQAEADPEVRVVVISGAGDKAFCAGGFGLMCACDLAASVDALINTLCARSPTGIRLGKQAFHAMRDMSLQQALDYAELMLPMMSATQDAREGMKAFQEKRAPVWKNR